MGYSGRHHIAGVEKGGVKGVVFNHIFVPDDLLNSFLYRLLLSNRRKELIQRINEGRKSEIDRNDPSYHGWLLEHEDKWLKQIIVNENKEHWLIVNDKGPVRCSSEFEGIRTANGESVIRVDPYACPICLNEAGLAWQ